jgi:hypothetical protein
MKGRWFRWVIRISLGFPAILIVPIAALFILNPEGTIILIGVLIAPLIQNTHPPPIAEDQLVGVSWQSRAEGGRKLTAGLQAEVPNRNERRRAEIDALELGIQTLASASWRLRPARAVTACG